MGFLDAAGALQDYTIVVQDSANQEISNFLRKSLSDFNFPYVRPKSNERFVIYARSRDGYVIGGLSGYIMLNHAFIEYTWVNPCYRGFGIGTKLMQSLEKFSKERGYSHIDLCTFAFQAPLFYEKMGFTKAGEVKKWVGDYDVYFYRKEVK